MYIELVYLISQQVNTLHMSHGASWNRKQLDTQTNPKYPGQHAD